LRKNLKKYQILYIIEIEGKVEFGEKKIEIKSGIKMLIY